MRRRDPHLKIGNKKSKSRYDSHYRTLTRTCKERTLVFVRVRANMNEHEHTYFSKYWTRTNTNTVFSWNIEHERTRTHGSLKISNTANTNKCVLLSLDISHKLWATTNQKTRLDSARFGIFSAILSVFSWYHDTNHVIRTSTDSSSSKRTSPWNSRQSFKLTYFLIEEENQIAPGDLVSVSEITRCLTSPKIIIAFKKFYFNFGLHQASNSTKLRP